MHCFCRVLYLVDLSFKFVQVVFCWNALGNLKMLEEDIGLRHFCFEVLEDDHYISLIFITESSFS